MSKQDKGQKSVKQWKIGLGLRIPHYSSLFQEYPDIDFFEIISENFMLNQGPPLENLKKVLSHYPVVMHGVSLNLGSVDPLNEDYLKKLKNLQSMTQSEYVTDHLCWTGAEGINYHDLLPLPYTESIANYLVERIKKVQDFLNVPFGLENLSSYVNFRQSEMSEWEFYNYIIDQSGCHYMLDINNIYVSSVNHQFDPREYLNSIKWDKVLQCHIAGHSKLEDGSIIDTHDHPVCHEVWDLYHYAWKLSGGFHTLLEWDDKIPTLSETWEEAQKARKFQKKPLNTQIVQETASWNP